MKKNFFAIICLNIVFFLAILLSPVYSHVPDTLQNQKNAAVTVHVNDRNGNHILSGSGFIVDRDGIIATNCLVIAKWLNTVESIFDVELQGGIHLPIEELISSKCTNHLALIRVDAKDLPEAKLATDYAVKQGEDIVMISGPSGEKSISENGVIKSIREKDKSFQISIPIKQEKSGSPLFNMKGEVIGAAVFLPKKAPKNSTAVFLKDIAKQIERHGATKHQHVSVPLSPPSLPAKKETKNILKGPGEYFLLGCNYDKTGMYKEAINAYNQSLHMKPDYVEAYVNLGLIYYKLGRYSDAIEAYKQALNIDPNSLAICNKLGTTYIINGSYSQAINTFKKALAVDPNNSAAHFNLGIAYFLTGDTTGAFAEYQTLMKMDKDRADILRDIIN